MAKILKGFAQFFYLSIPTMLTVCWFLFSLSYWLINYYSKCIENYITFFNDLYLYSITVFIILAILMAIYVFFQNKFNIYENSLLIEDFPLHPIYYVALASLSKIFIYFFTDTINTYFYLWIIIGIISLIYLYKGKGDVNFSKVSVLVTFFVIIYTIVIINWPQLSPYIKDILIINNCIIEELMK